MLYPVLRDCPSLGNQRILNGPVYVSPKLLGKRLPHTTKSGRHTAAASHVAMSNIRSRQRGRSFNKVCTVFAASNMRANTFGCLTWHTQHCMMIASQQDSWQDYSIQMLQNHKCLQWNHFVNRCQKQHGHRNSTALYLRPDTQCAIGATMRQPREANSRYTG